MQTKKEKELAIELLTEKLQRISGKKVILEKSKKPSIKQVFKFLDAQNFAQEEVEDIEYIEEKISHYSEYFDTLQFSNEESKKLAQKYKVAFIINLVVEEVFKDKDMDQSKKSDFRTELIKAVTSDYEDSDISKLTKHDVAEVMDASVNITNYLLPGALEEGKVLTEISDELKDKAIKRMQSQGRDVEASEWIKHYGTKDLKVFVGKPIFKEVEIKSFSIEDGNLVMHYGSPNSQQYNRTHGRSIYYIKEDKWAFYPIYKTDRKSVRIMSLIAKKINPETQYKTGIGDLEVKG